MAESILGLSLPFVTLLPLNKEYDAVSEAFKKSIKKENICVSAVFKITNPAMMDAFEARRLSIAELRGAEPEVVTVYHGTTLGAAESIIQTGFDPSFSRVAAYGKGTYASPSAATALTYCKDVKSAADFSMIFQCKFIKGKFTAAGNGGIIDTAKGDYSGDKSHILVTPYREAILPTYLLCYYSWAT